jgi:branched-chain amino acid transport system substrate-binding protein
MRRRDLLTGATRSACVLALPGLATSTWAAEPGVTSSQITLGSSLALSGILAGAGSQHTAGVLSAFKAVNKRGGLSGRQVKLQSLDDAYVPAKTVANVQQFLGDPNVFALISSMGTGNTAAILKMVEEAQVPLVGPVTGAASLRQAALRQVFYVRASYRDETTRLMQQMLSWGMNNIAMVYLDNAFGKEVLKDAEAAMTAGGVKLAGAFALAGNGSNGEQLAEQVLAVRPGAVMLGTTGSANTAFLKPFRERSPGTPVAGLSVSVITSEIAKLGPAVKGLALTQVLPDASSTRKAVVRSFQADMQASGDDKDIGGSSFEGWINAQVMLEGLRRAGPDLRRDKLRAALAGMRRLDLGDFNLGFGGEGPFVASQFVDLAILSTGGKRVS